MVLEKLPEPCEFAGTEWSWTGVFGGLIRTHYGAAPNELICYLKMHLQREP